MIKKLLPIVIILIGCIVATYFYVIKQTDQYLASTVQIESPQLITVKPGMNLGLTLKAIEQNLGVSPSFSTRLIRYLHPELTKIKAGTYQVKPSQSVIDVITQMMKGKEHQFSITLIEGNRFIDWRKELAEAPGLTHTIQDMSEAEISKTLGIEHAKLEGLFLPETYHYTQGTSDITILKRSNTALNNALTELWEGRQDKLPIATSYEALILASIVEKETGIHSERARIASVFINRLNANMRLQTDPTVIYGMGDGYDGNIRKKDLRTPTAYNTYVIMGLPPTPIAMASLDSIKATLQPEEKSRYYYFVASGDGGHVFSRNLNQHNRAVRAYLKKLRANK